MSSCSSNPSIFQILEVFSALAEANCLPSGEKITLAIAPLCPLRVCNSLPSFQILTVWSALAVANSLPSGEKMTFTTSLLCPVRVCTFAPLSMATIVAVLPLAIANCLPSGEKVTLLIPSAKSRFLTSLLSIFQILTVRSILDEAKNLLSLEKAMLVTTSRCPVKVCNFLPVTSQSFTVES